MTSSAEPRPHPRPRRGRIAVLAVIVAVLAVLYVSIYLSTEPHTAGKGTSSTSKTPGSGLPPAASLTSEPEGWLGGTNITAWADAGDPVVFFEGATWSPYCAASSWAIYAALASLGGLPTVSLNYSNSSDVYPETPEVVLAGAALAQGPLSFLAAEDTSDVNGQFPVISNSTEQAYVAAYAAGSIPFLVVNGQYIHAGSSIVNPATLSRYAGGADGGAASVQASIQAESGPGWSAASNQTFLLLAFVALSLGVTPSSLAAQYGWSAVLTSGVESAVESI